MTGPAAKSAISNAGDGKAVSGACSNQVSGCKMIDLVPPHTNLQPPERAKADKRLGEPLWVLLPCRKVIQMGNAG